jgi:hypothetical protein
MAVSCSLNLLRGAHGLPARQSEGTAVSRETVPKQLLHLGFGGVVHLHRLLAPDAGAASH